MFSGDTDMVTDGWVSLTSIDRPEIVITEVTSDEHNVPDGLLRCEGRINSELARSDLRIVWLSRVVDRTTSQPGMSFQEFQRAYIPPQCFYRDIFDPHGEATVIREESLDSFRSSGGRVIYATSKVA